MWVIQDFTASNAKELSVTKGQQLEILDNPVSIGSTLDGSPPAMMVLVRVSQSSLQNHSANPEGLVPLSCLKLPPGGPRSQSKSNTEAPDGGKSTFPWVDGVSA